MAAGIVYLDVDDEITSAAQRIRSSVATRIALVVPYGSRIATSRMNFRLLSREALVSNRRLSIVAGDAASRALAASAGLPVFATVAEYEGASGDGGSPPAAADGDRDADVSTARAAVVATLADSETVAAVGPPPAPERAADAAPPAIERPDRNRKPVRPRPVADEPATDATVAMAIPALAGAGADGGPGVVAPGRPQAPTRPQVRPTDGGPRDRDDDERDVVALPRVGAPLLIGLAIVALALIVAGVAAYLFLPSATIAITPRREPISVELTVTADPDATAVDAAAGTVPAVRVPVPVEVAQTFTTSGVHVEQAAATGTVTFSNYNFLQSNSVPAGSVVSTEGGIRFKTLASITVPAGTFVLPNVVPGKRSVKVQAVKTGPAGNVDTNAIRNVPPGEDPDILKVTNEEPTTGGVRTESPEVSKAEVDKAMATLRGQLQAAFDDAVATGANAPPGTTLFPKTAILGDATPSVDPASLVGQGIPAFDLSLTATGSVIAVDPSPVHSLAETQLDAKVGADHQLVDGSVQVVVGEGTVDESGTVTFDATAHGARVLVVDPDQLRALVKGKTKAQAEAALAPFGTAHVDLWPSWATTITGVDARLSVTVATDSGPAASQAPEPSSPRPSAAPSRRVSVPPVTPGRSGTGSSAP
jgi:Baseplate J-like protein